MKKVKKETIIYILVSILILIMGTEIGILRNKVKVYENKLEKVDKYYQEEINETIRTYEAILEE